MNEKRRSQRIKLLGTGWLQHEGSQYFCRLENISRHGARVGLKTLPTPPIQQGEKCYLRLSHDSKEPEYVDFMAQIIRFESAGAGLEFLGVEDASLGVLDSIIQKEQYLSDGAEKIIGLAWKLAELRGIGLQNVYFDKGELMPEREVHTLRFVAGEYTSNVCLHRAEIEEFYIQDGTMPVRAGIHKAIDQLNELTTRNN